MSYHFIAISRKDWESWSMETRAATLLLDFGKLISEDIMLQFDKNWVIFGVKVDNKNK